jgi:hypothetical protein
MRRIITLVVLAIAVASALLAFSPPGHRVLNSVGISTACAWSYC